MEEDEYKSTYNELATVRCVFEKTLVNHQASHQAKCSLSRHFCLADREGYSCEDAKASEICGEVLGKLREKSIFVLKLREINGPLPHNMELRVQAGGIAGLARLLASGIDKPLEESVPANDIHRVISSVIEKYGVLDKVPYSEIIQSVEQFQGRRRRQR